MNKEQNESLIRAAQYMRTATEQQKDSMNNQADTILEFAIKNGMEIVRTYADEGKSGLNMKGRDALKQMLDDVTSGRADYEVILIYDISRWGRFQDNDQSAEYEYICKKNNIRVEYCAERCKNNEFLSSTIMKAMKRTMAAEYAAQRIILERKTGNKKCQVI